MEKSKTTPIKNLTNSNYKQVISDILENYKTNPEDLIELARFSKNFTKYSINNDILLYKQNSGATFVATYNQWQNLGYKVIEKGSGMKLLQPNTLTFFYNENNELKPIKEATKIEQEKIKNKEYKTVRKIVSFSTFIVHDISSTNCPVEEYPNFYNMGYPSELHKNIADALIDYCAENKIMVSEENLNSISIRGLANKTEDIIKLNSLMKDTQKLSTLVHEIGHIKLHTNNEETSKKSPALIEFEADLLSIMFSCDYNLEIIDTRKQHFVSSFKAIDKENFDLMKTLNEVHKEYKKLSKAFNKYIEKQLTINNISLDNGLEKNRLSKIKEILDSGNYIHKSIIEAKAGEFCIGENKNPLQIIEKNGNEYKAVDLVTKKEFSSSFESKFENKDNNIASVPIFKNDKVKDMYNDITVKINYSEHPLFNNDKYRTLSFLLANKLLTELDKKAFEVDVGYLKTDFSIALKNGYILDDRFDIGSEKLNFISFLKNLKDENIKDILDYFEKNTELSLEDNIKFNEIMKEADKLHNEMLKEFGIRKQNIELNQSDEELKVIGVSIPSIPNNIKLDVGNNIFKDIDLNKLIGKTITYNSETNTIIGFKNDKIILNYKYPKDSPHAVVFPMGVTSEIFIEDIKEQLINLYDKTVEVDKNTVVEKKDVSKIQGYKKYNLDEINQIPIKTILDDLGYEPARNKMYNIRGEKTASVKVYEKTNTYYDFGSTNGGNVISLIKETQNMDTKEAINYLGERYGIPYEQIGIDNQEKRLFLSNKEWKDLGVMYPEKSSKNYVFNLEMPQDELKSLSDKLQKINMNDLATKEPQLFKEIVQNKVIPQYIDDKNQYLKNIHTVYNAEEIYKNTKTDIELTKYICNDLAKTQYMSLKNSYKNLEKIKKFIPDLKIDKLQVDFKKDLKNINNKSIEIGSFKHREMKELDGIKNYLTIPYKNYAEFEKEAKDFSYSAFLKGDKVTLTVLNTDKQQAQDLISQVKQLDFQKQNQKKTNISLEK